MNSNKNLSAIFPLFLAVFIDCIGLSLVFPILTPLFYDSSGILPVNDSETLRSILFGITLAMWPLAMFFATPILGELSDEIGRKKILVFCLGLVGISYFLSGIAVLADSVSLMIVSRFLAGLCAGCVPVAQAAVIDICPPDQKPKYLSLLLFPASLGFVAGPLFSTLLGNARWISWFGLWTPLFFAGILALFNAALLWATLQETHVKVGKLHLNIMGAVHLFVDAFNNKAVRFLSLIFLLFEFAWGLYFQYISLFMLHAFHYNATQIGWFMAWLACGFAVAFLIIIPWLSKHFKNLPVIRVSFVVSAVFMAVCVLCPWASIVWLATFIACAANGVLYSFLLSICSDTVGPERQGWIMGVTAAVTALAFAVTALLTGLLSLISVGTPLYVASAAMVVATLLTFRFL